MPLATFPWTAPEQNELEELHRQGLTCSEIGRRLGRSRNSIIGRLMRTGLTAKGYKEGYRTRPTPAQRSRQTKQAMGLRRMHPTKTAAQAALETIAHMEASHPDKMRLIGLLDLQHDSCRFPIGDPRNEDFRYCGNDKLSGLLSYCAHHARMAYTPPETRRRHPGVANAPKA